jgi:hypothetical protein
MVAIITRIQSRLNILLNNILSLNCAAFVEDLFLIFIS